MTTPLPPAYQVGAPVLRVSAGGYPVMFLTMSAFNSSVILSFLLSFCCLNESFVLQKAKRKRYN